jgi:hypothetical protein
MSAALMELLVRSRAAQPSARPRLLVMLNLVIFVVPFIFGGQSSEVVVCFVGSVLAVTLYNRKTGRTLQGT